MRRRCRNFPVRVRLLEHPTDEEIEEATAVAVRSFPWDNIAISMTGNKPELFSHIYRMQFGAARVAGRTYVVSPQDSDKILAAGLWFGPGTTMMKTEEQRAAGYNQFLDMLDETTRHWWTFEYREALKAVDAAYGKEGILPSWYANLIATDPEHQGKGYGTLLVQAGIRSAKEDNTFAALGTSSQKLVSSLPRAKPAPTEIS